MMFLAREVKLLVFLGASAGEGGEKEKFELAELITRDSANSAWRV